MKRKREPYVADDLHNQLALLKLNDIVDKTNAHIEDVQIMVGEVPNAVVHDPVLVDAIVKLNASTIVHDELIVTKADTIVQPLRHFTAPPKPNQIVYLFILRHGGYKINPNLTYNIVECPVSNLIRLQYAPYGACAFYNNIDARKIYFDLCRTILPHALASFDDLSTLKENILRTTSIIANTNKESPIATTDYYSTIRTLPIGQQNMYHNISNSNAVLTNKLGDKLLDKTYEVDNKLDDTESGMPILYTVMFKLPDIFFDTKINEARLLREVTYYTSNPPIYQIGEYNVETQIITYQANTELWSCPFFQLFVSLLGVKYTLAVAFSWTKPGVWRPMIDKITSDVVFRYFQYADMIVLFDYSCSSFIYDETTYEQLQQNNEHLIKIKDTLFTRKPGEPRGGHTRRTKRRQTNKQQRIKQKRRNKQRQRQTYKKKRR